MANADGRAQVITLALVLGALEARTGKDALRNPPRSASPARTASATGEASPAANTCDSSPPTATTPAALEEVVTGTRTGADTYDA